MEALTCECFRFCFSEFSVGMHRSVSFVMLVCMYVALPTVPTAPEVIHHLQIIISYVGSVNNQHVLVWRRFNASMA